MQPQIVLLKEGTETAQGKQQVVSNINACQVSNIGGFQVLPQPCVMSRFHP